jgi:pyridoxal 5'-phosphate synthase pdxT subunit
MRIGVLALQGAFIEHIAVLQCIGAEAVAVRLPHQLEGLDGLIIPGGESTSMLHLMHSFGLMQPLRERAKKGFPILGTCAGTICLAKDVPGHDMETLSVMDVTVRRNRFGRQVDSFETDVAIRILGEEPFRGVFIRAPSIVRAGRRVEVMAVLPEGDIVVCTQGKLMAVVFHPELTSDLRLHDYFLNLVAR